MWPPLNVGGSVKWGYEIKSLLWCKQQLIEREIDKNHTTSPIYSALRYQRDIRKPDQSVKF